MENKFNAELVFYAETGDWAVWLGDKRLACGTIDDLIREEELGRAEDERSRNAHPRHLCGTMLDRSARPGAGLDGEKGVQVGDSVDAAIDHHDTLLGDPQANRSS